MVSAVTAVKGAAKAATKAATGDAAKAVAGASVPNPAAPAKVIQVRSHTRAAPTKLAPVTVPGLNTETVKPADTSSVQRFAPHFVGEPVAGSVGAFKNPDGSWVNPGTKPQPGAYIAERPFYTDTNTLRVHAGPKGDSTSQLNAADLAAAHGIEVANYGTPRLHLPVADPGRSEPGQHGTHRRGDPRGERGFIRASRRRGW